jgi:hypothetical protein
MECWNVGVDIRRRASLNTDAHSLIKTNPLFHYSIIPCNEPLRPAHNKRSYAGGQMNLECQSLAVHCIQRGSDSTC